jgi:hypothetical protein
LPTEAELTPQAAERVCREAAQKSFDEAARSLEIDFGVSWDGKQIQRWAEAFGDRRVRERDAEVLRYQQGQRPTQSGLNEPLLLVIGVDGGRYQSREKDPETGSRWREDKVCTVTTYVPGDGGERKPQKLITTHLATARDAHAFGPMVRVEAERRGLCAAEAVTLMGDCGNWIDPLHQEHLPAHQRIADYDHAVEHLWEASRAILGPDSPKVPKLAQKLETWLYAGQVKKVIRRLQRECRRLGPLKESDGEHEPRRVLWRETGYFQRNGRHMDYPAYRARGWPIGGVKQFNKRLKGTEQFWGERGIESMLAMRSMWICQDLRWAYYWAARPAYTELRRMAA